MKRIISGLIIFTFIFSCIAVSADEIRSSASNQLAPQELPENTKTEEVKKEIKFSDVKEDSTTGKDIYKLVSAGILNGYTDGTFKPNNPITRAELCKVINLAFNYTEADTTAFKDVKKEDWFYSYVMIAKKAGYITGHADGTFKGNDNLTREQTCAVITRVVELFDISMTEKITDKVSEWAVPYVNKVVANKVILLEEGGKFRATQNITRGELVSAIAKFVVVKDEEVKNEDGTKYTVTFNSNGGSTVASASVESGKTVTKPANPTKKGYTFAGWYTDSGLKKSFDFNTKITANITLYAKWETASAGGGGGGGGGGTTTYTVTFNSNGGSTVSPVSVSSGKTIEQPADPTKLGNTFAGWYSDSGLTKEFSFASAITANITLYAKWTQGTTVTPYNVTFVTNSGSSIDKVVIESGKTVDKPADPTREGYKFLGWYTNEALTNSYNFSTSVKKHITLYAKWVRVYTVTFDTDGGPSVDSVVVETGKTIDEPDHGTWDGYYFMGWYRLVGETRVKFNFSDPVSKDITLYAKWTWVDSDKQEEVVGKIESLLDGDENYKGVNDIIGDFGGKQREMLNKVKSVMTSVLKDANKGIPVYVDDYILDNYSVEYSEVKSLYQQLSEDDQSSFYSTLITLLGADRANDLLEVVFGLDISAVKNKMENKG